MTCREETESYGVRGGGGGGGDRGKEGVEEETWKFVRLLVVRSFCVILSLSLCATSSSTLCMTISLSLSLCLSRILSASHRPPIARKTNEFNERIQQTNSVFLIFLEKSTIHVHFSIAYQTSEKTRHRNKERTVIHHRLYVWFFCIAIIIHLFISIR